MPGLNQKSYDIVIGIPSFNNSNTIKYVVETAAKGLGKFFPSLRGCISIQTEDRRTILKRFSIQLPVME
jgi:hypothetical protein